ncbi:MAG: hypothetical protein HZA25_03350 [Candidatus Niyogibacteria bacterium]|nr:hypothetical protein [Candidatus Niyogibacteria bacterium]
MYIHPGQKSIPWQDFEHFTHALALTMSLDVGDAAKLAFDYLMDAHIGIHCDFPNPAQHKEVATEETLEVILHLGGL